MTHRLTAVERAVAQILTSLLNKPYKPESGLAFAMDNGFPDRLADWRAALGAVDPALPSPDPTLGPDHRIATLEIIIYGADANDRSAGLTIWRPMAAADGAPTELEPSNQGEN